MEKKLHRIPEQAVFGGVASGIAQYLQIDVVIVRVLFVVMLLLPLPPGFGLTGLLYIILWAVLPTGPATVYPLGGEIPKAVDPVSEKKRSEQTVMILGGVLVAFGALMLLDDFPIWYTFKRYAWPIIFIAVGAFLILRQRDKEQENNATVYPTTPPPPAPPVDPVKPVNPDPDPQPYTPFNSPTTSHFPEDPENKKPDDDDDQVIKVN